MLYGSSTETSIQLTDEPIHSAVNFVKTFSSDASAREKIDALRRACKTHTALTKQCASGLGQDRILYAMYCLAQQRRKRAQRARTASMSGGSAVFSSSSDEEDSDGPQAGLAGAEVSARIAARILEQLRDPGYAQLGHSTISTSNCGDPSLAYFGFGPVVSDGLGIGYIIKVRLGFFFPRASEWTVDDCLSRRPTLSRSASRASTGKPSASSMRSSRT